MYVCILKACACFPSGTPNISGAIFIQGSVLGATCATNKEWMGLHLIRLNHRLDNLNKSYR